MTQSRSRTAFESRLRPGARLPPNGWFIQSRRWPTAAPGPGQAQPLFIRRLQAKDGVYILDAWKGNQKRNNG